MIFIGRIKYYTSYGHGPTLHVSPVRCDYTVADDIQQVQRRLEQAGTTEMFYPVGNVPTHTVLERVILMGHTEEQTVSNYVNSDDSFKEEFSAPLLIFKEGYWEPVLARND